MAERFANAPATTTLATAIASHSAGDTVQVIVSSASGFPTSGDFRLRIGAEYFKVTAVSGTTFTATASPTDEDNSTAAAHVVGEAVTHVVTKGAFAQFPQLGTANTYTEAQTIQATGLGHTITYEFGSASNDGSGMQGPKLYRDSVGRPIGWGVGTNGTLEWDFGLDATTDDFVFLYDPDTPADQFRVRKGPHFQMGYSLAQPEGTYRFRIDSDYRDTAPNPDMTDLLVLGVTDPTAAQPGPVTRILSMFVSLNRKWNVYAPDGSMAIGHDTPLDFVHAKKDQAAATRFLVSNANTGTSGRAGFRAIADSGSRSMVLEMFSTGFGTASLQGHAMLYSSGTGVDMLLGSAGSERMRLDASGNISFGTGSLATSATDGFPYMPAMAGAPSGTPTAKTGRVPFVYDSTNHRIYVYSGSWRKADLS